MGSAFFAGAASGSLALVAVSETKFAETSFASRRMPLLSPNGVMSKCGPRIMYEDWPC